MAFNPGRNAGRVSIRVVPDTKLFRADTKRQLERATRDLKVKIEIDGVILDRRKVREDLQRQIETLGGVKVDVDAIVTVDKAKLHKTKLRASIQRQFDEFDDIRVKIAASIANKEHFEHEVKHLVDKASRNEVKIDVAAHTLPAAAGLKWLARDRLVNVFVNVNKASFASAMTTLSALSGARLAGSWLDDIRDFGENLDKNLPKILKWTSGLTALTSALFAGTAEIVAFGQGFVAMTPGLLVVPGMLMNAVGSLTAFVVAMRDAKEQLSPLKDDMSELADIITGTYWDRARQPILNLVDGLMPQLRNSFTDLSAGIGDFTSALSNELANDLANGRLESIFKGVADGWRVLADGADGIAGALVSLSQIGATYTPRLAAWFTRQAKTFSNWLEAIANDGRLDQWMEGAIDSMYDFWDATKGVAGVFEGLYTAADKAGAGGLRGFADLMLRWERNVKSDGVQRGLATLFSGAKDAMSELGDGINRFMGMTGQLAPQIAGLMRSTATFAGGIIGGFSDAMKSTAWVSGLDKLNDDLIIALERIEPSMKPIADTFGNLVGLVGEMSKTALPAAATVIAELTPALDGIISAVSDVLPDLSDTVTSIAQTLGPPLGDFVKNAAPALGEALRGVASILETIAPVLGEVLKGIQQVTGLDKIDLNRKADFDRSGLAPDPKSFKGDVFDYWEAYVDAAQKWADDNPVYISGAVKPPSSKEQEMVKTWTEGVRGEFEKGGLGAAQSFWDKYKLGSAAPGVRDEVLRQLREFGININTELGNAAGGGAGGGLSLFLTRGIDGAIPSVQNGIARMRGAVTEGMRGSESWLTGAGSGVVGGFLTGASGQFPGVSGAIAGGLAGQLRTGTAGSSTWLSPAGIASVSGFLTGARGQIGGAAGAISGGLNGGIVGSMNGAGNWLDPSGRSVVSGFRYGADQTIPQMLRVFTGISGAILYQMGNMGNLLYGVGRNLMFGMSSGINSAVGNVAAAAAGAAGAALNAAKRRLDIHSPSRAARREVGQMWGKGLALGITDSTREIRRAASEASAISYVPGGPSRVVADAERGPKREVNLHIHHPVVRDLTREAWEAAQMVGEGF
ncbi:hypothetical protein [Microbacterium arborescens]|uniref:hypothetical protein n=1 Tax=Microbacterium arborescens TaxID=33883 RepID=UPI000DF77E26|nr:hypothetical protein [Microbacterium arborescens]